VLDEQQDLQELVVQPLFPEQLVVEQLELQVQLELQLLVQVEQRVLQLERALLLVVVPLELVEHLCLVQMKLRVHLAY